MIEPRDRRRAALAHRCLQGLPAGEFDDYKIAVNSLGAYVMRNGLAAAIAWLERDKSKAATKSLFAHLADAEIMGLGASADGLPQAVRDLDAPGYMLASRDFLNVVTWFRRAVQARGSAEAPE